MQLFHRYGVRPGALFDDSGIGGGVAIVFRSGGPTGLPNEPFGPDPLRHKSRMSHELGGERAAGEEARPGPDPKQSRALHPSPAPESLAQMYEQLRTPDGDELEMME